MFELDGQPAGQRIAAIAALTDPVARNRAITAAYHQLALGVRHDLGGDDASWCAFAVWASATAGQSIGLDEVPARVEQLLVDSEKYHDARRVLAHVLAHSEVTAIVEGTCTRVSAEIAAGNVMVFSELAPAYVAMLDGNELTGAPADVARAFAAYRQAQSETDPCAKAQYVLLANAVAVLHEQQRLQPAVAGALDAGLGEAAQAVARTRLGAFAERVLAPVLHILGHAVDDAWERALTEHFMTLRLPGEVLSLAHDVPALPGTPLFPVDLAKLSVADLVAFAATYDRTGGTGRGSAARDWRILGDRMNFIFNLFRSRQQHAPLFDDPFKVTAAAPVPPG